MSSRAGRGISHSVRDDTKPLTEKLKNSKTYELKNSFRLGQTAQGNHRSTHRYRGFVGACELHILGAAMTDVFIRILRGLGLLLVSLILM